MTLVNFVDADYQQFADRHVDFRASSGEFSVVLTKRATRAPIRHPDDLSNARGGRTSDSFAHAKPVPVSENRAAVLCSIRPAGAKFSLDTATQKPVPASLARSCPRSFLPLALLTSSG